VKVVLGGDGGDELFGGYDRYLGNQLVEYYAFVPRAVRHSVLRPLLRRIPESFGYKSLAQKARWMDRMADREDGVRYAESAMFLRFSHERKRALFTESLWREVGGADSSLRLCEFFDSPRVTDLVDRMLYTDVKTRLAEHLLLIVDRMTMAHSLEGRSPYLDPRVVEFAFSIPGDLKIRRRRLKHVQREVARTYLPPALVDRPKQGFGFPLGRWFRQDLAPLLQWLCARSLLVEAGYFERRGLRELVEEHLEGREDHNYRLWLVLNLELWYRIFVERASLDDVTSLIRSAGKTSREAEPVLRTS